MLCSPAVRAKTPPLLLHHNSVCIVLVLIFLHRVWSINWERAQCHRLPPSEVGTDQHEQMRSWATYWGVDCVILSLYYQIRFTALIIAIYIYHGAYFYSFTHSAVSRIFFFFCTTLQLSKATIWLAQLGSHAKSNTHIQINRWNEGLFTPSRRAWASSPTSHLSWHYAFLFGAVTLLSSYLLPGARQSISVRAFSIYYMWRRSFFARVGNFLAQASRQSWGEP